MRLYTDVRLTRRVQKHCITDDEGKPIGWYENLDDALGYAALMGNHSIDLYPGFVYGPYPLDLTKLQDTPILNLEDLEPY